MTTRKTLRWKIAQAAEWRWWKRYLGGKSIEEYKEWKTNYWNNFIQKYVSESLDHKNILDIGCGPAGLFMVLEPRATVHAVDPLLDKYEANLSHFAKADYPKVQFFDCALEDYTPNVQYDVIFCLNAINHVDDWQGSLELLFQWLAPNGVLYLSTDVHRHSFLRPIFKALPGDILHPHQHNLDEYLKAMTSIGFTVRKEQLVKRESIFDYRIIEAVK